MNHDAGVKPLLYSRLLWRLATPLLALLLLGVGSGCAAAPLTAQDAAQVRATVQGQLDALAADDAVRAFSYAAPNVRERVGTAARFLAMVRSGYPVVYRHASVDFLGAQSLTDGTVVQRVQMTDARGEAWMAVYTLQRQKDKAWRITGCDVQPGRGGLT